MYDDKFFDDLLKDTDFVMSSNGSLMNSTQRPKVRHPLIAINCICGGGIPMSLQTEFCGPPASGKTTSAYSMLGNYLKDNPDGIGVIVDTEGSMDTLRLEKLGVDMSRTIRLPAKSIENGFGNMFKMFSKLIKLKETKPNISVMVIFDSISSGGTDKQHKATEEGNSALNAGSMMELPRILKQNTANVFPYIEEIPILVVYINQVSTVGIGSYAPKVDSIGGFGFKHNMQFSLIYGNPKDWYENGFVMGSYCNVNIKKNKLCPKFIDIPCTIDVTDGGSIDEIASFFDYISMGNIGIIKTGSYYSIKDTIDVMCERYPILKDNKDLMSYYKSMRRKELLNSVREDKDLLNFLQIRFIDIIDDIYSMQRSINQDYQNNLIKNCKYFEGFDPETGEIRSSEDANNEFIVEGNE